MPRWSAADVISVVLSGLIIAGTFAAPRLAEGGVLRETTVCLSQRIAGVACPGCGMTRSVIALGRGELGEALRWNWVAPLMFALALLHLAVRGAKLGLPRLDLRAFDLASIAAIIVILLVRTVQIWLA